MARAFLEATEIPPHPPFSKGVIALHPPLAKGDRGDWGPKRPSISLLEQEIALHITERYANYRINRK